MPTSASAKRSLSVIPVCVIRHSTRLPNVTHRSDLRPHCVTPPFSPHYPTHYLGDTGWIQDQSVDGGWT
jgi:hypothetical protein